MGIRHGCKQPRKQSPRHTAAIKDLYYVVRRSSCEESLVSTILAKWHLPNAQPTISEIPVIPYFLALLYLRNPKTANFFDALGRLVAAESTKALAHDEMKFNKLWEHFLMPKASLTCIRLAFEAHTLPN